MFCCLQVKPLGLLKPSSLMKVSSRFKAHQDSLPRLPVPPLQQTLDHYLKALQRGGMGPNQAAGGRVPDSRRRGGAPAEGAGAQGQEDGELGE